MSEGREMWVKLGEALVSQSEINSLFQCPGSLESTL